VFFNSHVESIPKTAHFDVAVATSGRIFSLSLIFAQAEQKKHSFGYTRAHLRLERRDALQAAASIDSEFWKKFNLNRYLALPNSINRCVGVSDFRTRIAPVDYLNSLERYMVGCIHVPKIP